MSNEVRVKFDLGSGIFGGLQTGFRGSLETDVEVEFRDSCCPKHQYANIDLSNGRCEQCDKQITDLVMGMIQAFKGEISCEALYHGHECRCHLGHDCEADPCSVRDKLNQERADDDGDTVEPNEMMTLGAEAPSEVMLGVYQRLAALEKENTEIKKMLDAKRE